MRKRLIVFGALLICSVAWNSPRSTADQAQPNQRTVADVGKTSLDSVVLITTNDNLGRSLKEGSGFIISSEGRIVTNHHVIEGAASVTIKLSNGAIFRMESKVADDPDHDIAIIKVAGRNLPALTLISSDLVAVGERVVAIGSPLGLENSVSDGIVSGFREDEKRRKWIQTTAPVSPGNSGGPLLTTDGRVLGVITWGFVVGQNLNFAVPSETITTLISTAGKNSDATAPAVTQPIGLGRTLNLSVWTSMTSGRDYKLRVDGDYLYVEWVNVPPTLAQAGGFIRSELRKTGDIWAGKTRSHLPCQYYNQTRWCSVEAEIEITKIGETRIEGSALTWQKFNCRKCQPESTKMKPFTWIPKE